MAGSMKPGNALPGWTFGHLWLLWGESARRSRRRHCVRPFLLPDPRIPGLDRRQLLPCCSAGGGGELAYSRSPAASRASSRSAYS
jgi:hypothetical protein